MTDASKTTPCASHTTVVQDVPHHNVSKATSARLARGAKTYAKPFALWSTDTNAVRPQRGFLQWFTDGMAMETHVDMTVSHRD